MIIAPDFFEHWKTKALVELTKRPESPLWVQRLWAHCQTRKAWEFRDLSDLALKSICGVPADITPEVWKKTLLDCRFVRESGKKLVVHEWEEHNAALVVRWLGGKATAVKHKQCSGKAADKQTGGDGLDRIEGIDKRGGRKAPALALPIALSEVEAVAADLGLSPAEAGKFFDHFTANGWRQSGGNPIRNWHAAARNWARRSGGFVKKTAGGVAPAAPFNSSQPHAHTGGLAVLAPVGGESLTTEEAARGGHQS